MIAFDDHAKAQGCLHEDEICQLNPPLDLYPGDVPTRASFALSKATPSAAQVMHAVPGMSDAS